MYRQRKQISGRLARLETAASLLHPETDEELAQRVAWTVEYLTISGVIVVNTAGRWQVVSEFTEHPDRYTVEPGWFAVADLMNDPRSGYLPFAEKVAASGAATYTLPHPSGVDVVIDVDRMRTDDHERKSPMELHLEGVARLEAARELRE